MAKEPEISEATFHRWRHQRGRLTVAEYEELGTAAYVSSGGGALPLGAGDGTNGESPPGRAPGTTQDSATVHRGWARVDRDLWEGPAVGDVPDGHGLRTPASRVVQNEGPGTSTFPSQAWRSTGRSRAEPAPHRCLGSGSAPDGASGRSHTDSSAPMTPKPRAPDDEVVVPPETAPLIEILDFALTYNAYQHHGGFGQVARLSERTRKRWQETGSLRVRLGTARAALFFEQRSLHWAGLDGEEPDEVYIRALADRIRELSRGIVPGEADPLPGRE